MVEGGVSRGMFTLSLLLTEYPTSLISICQIVRKNICCTDLLSTPWYPNNFSQTCETQDLTKPLFYRDSVSPKSHLVNNQTLTLTPEMCSNSGI